MSATFNVTQAASWLRAGKVLMFPTDTVWALGADPLNQEAVRTLAALKQRADFRKPVALLCSSVEQICELASISAAMLHVIRAVPVGTTTFVVEIQAQNVPLYAHVLDGNNATIGVRIPNHKLSQCLIQQFGGPIAATSLNLTGKPPVARPEDIDKSFFECAHLLRDEHPPSGLASTVMRLHANGQVEILREGAMTKSQWLSISAGLGKPT